MPRKLPWVVDDAEKKAKKKAASAPPPKAHPANSEDEDLVDSDLNAVRPSTPDKKPPKKPILGSSPPSSPGPAAPATVYMREGYHADDIWRMVEDEFYTTAQTFTQHIHRAEYQRLRRLAKSRGKDVLCAVTHGTDGRTAQSGQMKMKLEVEGQAKKRKVVLRASESEESGQDEDAYMRDPQLAVLMKGLQPVGRNLGLGLGLDKVRSNTRAAAGFAQSPKNVERTRDVFRDNRAAPSAVASSDEASFESRKKPAIKPALKPATKPALKPTEKPAPDPAFSDDDDDLDAPVVRHRPTYAKAQKRMQSSDGAEEKSKSNGVGVEKPKSIFAQFAKPNDDSRNGLSPSLVPAKRPPTTSSSRPPKKATPATTTASYNRSTKEAPSADATAQYRAKKKAERERKEREEKRKANAADEIPTFLF